MSDVISPRTSNRTRLAAPLAGFAIAGAVHATTDAIVPVLGAILLAVAGVYGTGQYARRVTRRCLALRSLALWFTFLAVAGVHAIGVDTVLTSLAVPVSAGNVGVAGLTWGTLLGACSTTAFLGFREYGSPAGIEAADDAVIDGDSIR